ncbi:hypothetical protein IV203_020013 [Nitzschia inconspicua]|uniref:Uncharacterized protein n=1 Tax=Nitzschia inconspicua TaxID=303405 RepID=A0A9K3Q534_9STRA|nr:hypothetical protein IV203_020013 [Nitzschia inconspicua]
MDKSKHASTVKSVNNSKALLKHSFVADFIHIVINNGGSVTTFKLLQCSSFNRMDENKHCSILNTNYTSINNSKTFLKYNVGHGDDTNIIPSCPPPMTHSWLRL